MYVYVFQVFSDKGKSKEAGGKGTKRKHNTMQSHPAKNIKK